MVLCCHATHLILLLSAKRDVKFDRTFLRGHSGELRQKESYLFSFGCNAPANYPPDGDFYPAIELQGKIRVRETLSL
jgi:hypothetical protein